MAAPLPKLYTLRLLQLSLGRSLEGLTPQQLGLAEPEAPHDVFPGHTRLHSPPSYRVRLCRRCSGTSERLDKGTYDTLEEACLVHDSWQLMFGSEEKCQVLVPGDEKWVKDIVVRKLSRKVQSVITIGEIFASEGGSTDEPPSEQNSKRSASELVPYQMYAMDQQRDGLGSLVNQFIFFEQFIANSLVRDNIPLTSALHAFAAAVQTQHRRKVARLMREAVGSDKNKSSLLPRSALILLQANLLRMILTASLHVPLEEINGVVKRVEELAPVVPAKSLVHEVDQDLAEDHRPFDESAIERGQVLAATAMRFVMEFELACLFPMESELHAANESVWAAIDKLYNIMENAHVPFQKLARLVLRWQNSPFYQENPQIHDGTVKPMITNAMRLLALGRGPVAAILVYFAPGRKTLHHVNELCEDFTLEAKLFPDTILVIQALTRETWLHALVAKVKLQTETIVNAHTMAEMDAVALFVIAFRYTQFGNLRRDVEWRAEGPPELEMWALAAILSYACFRPSLIADQQLSRAPDYVNLDNVVELVGQNLQADQFDEGNWFYNALLNLFPQFTVQNVVAEIAQLLAEYVAYARELQIGFLTNFGIPGIALLLRLVKHHCPDTDPALIRSICHSCERIFDLNNQRFGVIRLLEPLLEQPLYVVDSVGEARLPIDLLAKPRSVAELLDEAYEDSSFYQFYNLT